MNLDKLVPERKEIPEMVKTDERTIADVCYDRGYNAAITDMYANIAKAKVGLDIEKMKKIVDWHLRGLRQVDREKTISKALADKAEELITVEVSHE